MNITAWVTSDIHQQWWLFNITRQQLPWSHAEYIFSIERPLAAETTNCTFKFIITEDRWENSPDEMEKDFDVHQDQQL